MLMRANMEKNGSISKLLLGLVISLVVVCVGAWVNYVYASVSSLQLRDVEISLLVSENAKAISSMRECTRNLENGISRIERKLDQVIDANANRMSKD